MEQSSFGGRQPRNSPKEGKMMSKLVSVVVLVLVALASVPGSAEAQTRRHQGRTWGGSPFSAEGLCSQSMSG